MAEGITLIDVNIEPTKGVNRVIKESFEAIKLGLKKSNAEKLHAFRILGENRFIVVAAGDVDQAVWEINEKHGDKIRLTSTPMRSYFEFVEKTLGVKKELIPTEIKDLTPGGNMYWHAIHVTYEGMTIDELTKLWNHEASLALPLMKENNIEVSAFKTIFQKDAHVFLKNNPHDADHSVWTLPMWREMGNKISSVCKPIKHME